MCFAAFAPQHGGKRDIGDDPAAPAAVGGEPCKDPGGLSGLVVHAIILPHELRQEHEPPVGRGSLQRIPSRPGHPLQPGRRQPCGAWPS